MCGFAAAFTATAKITETIQPLHDLWIRDRVPNFRLSTRYLEERMHLEDAIMLFWKLGIDVRSLPAKDFTLAYHRLARRYHPDQGNRSSDELMANINAARTVILKAKH
jgi:hypothetical protein